MRDKFQRCEGRIHEYVNGAHDRVSSPLLLRMFVTAVGSAIFAFHAEAPSRQSSL
jgi:hypothetical protein